MRLAFALALGLALAACGRTDSAPDAVLRVDAVGNIDEAGSPPRVALIRSTQLGLVQYDGKGQIVPGLAASWRVVDQGRSLIFRLRDARWSDGRILKAGDVVEVFRRIVAPTSRNPLKPLLAGIENAPEVMAGTRPASALGVNAPLDMVVEIRLSAPDTGMLELLALPEAAIVRAARRPPAIGAFNVADPEARPLRLLRNTNYFDAGDTRLGSVVLTGAPEAATALARFRRGDTDVVIGNGVDGMLAARGGAPRGTMRIEPSWGAYLYLANQKRGILADARVRRALAMAIDRDTLVREVFDLPEVVPLVSLVPPDAGGGAVQPPVPDWTVLAGAARTALAAQLLGAAGIDPRHRATVTVSLLPGREHAAVFEAVARAWQPLGIDARGVVRQPADQRRAIALGDYDLALVERTAPAAQPLFFLRPFTCAGSRGGYCNPGADALIDGARTMADEDGRAAALAHAESVMLADTPAIPLFVPVRWALVGRSVTGWTENQGGQHPFAALGKLK